MKAFFALVAVSLTLASTASSFAQPYGGPQGRGYYYDDRERGPRYRDRGYAFDERAYLRCYADVRRAVYRGQFESGREHYMLYGRREGRRPYC
jgi:hypothetical protein